ncbi:reverse transcriptase [Gossypium australe]|uniref:Reverse transcriptase n=1 Tax=Gossypium australe TaxID=47621 RepID=A0A5B6VXS7_9ROSI|nr:reverse transcriptase [Gossypium australe]
MFVLIAPRVLLCWAVFDRSWVDIIVKCIIFVSYSVIVNGKAGEIFRPTRGLWQGDPLSLFLFLVCSEGLSTLMRLALRDSFKSDCAIFEEANDRGAHVLKVILREYELCLGQCINYDKSIVFYSFNTSERDREMVSCILGVRYSNDLENVFNGLFSAPKDTLWGIGKLYGEILVAKRPWKKGNNWCKWSHLLRGLLQSGLCWRVGTGEKILVVEDVWLPGANSYKLSSSIINPSISLVSDLIDNNSRVWKRKVIENTFSRDDVARILRIPLAKKDHNDFQVWRDESSRDFLVRSAYKLLQAAKALTCSQAVQMGVDMGLLVVIIEGDALSIIKKCQLDIVDKLEIGV